MSTEPAFILKPDSSEVRHENLLLGSIFRDPRLFPRAAAALTPESFSSPVRAVVFEAMVACEEDGQPADLVNVVRRLRETGKLSVAGGAAGVGALAEGMPPGVHTGSLIDAVVETSRRLDAARMLNRGAAELARGASGVEVATSVTDAAHALLMGGVGSNLVALEAEIPETLRHLVDLAEGTSSPGLDVGIPSIDALLAGLSPGDVWYLAAKPSTGKSSMMLTIIAYLAATLSKKVAAFSLEMQIPKQVRRLLAFLSGVNSEQIKKARMRPEQWALILQAAIRLKSLPIWMNDSRPMSINRLRAEAKMLHAEVGLDFLVIDYLQLVSAGVRLRSPSDQNAILTIVSNGIHDLAGELGIPILALCSMNRAIDQGVERRPRLSDLRGSGSLESDADIVSFLHKVLDANGDETGRIEHIVAKNRDGAIGTSELRFLKHVSRFTAGRPIITAA